LKWTKKTQELQQSRSKTPNAIQTKFLANCQNSNNVVTLSAREALPWENAGLLAATRHGLENEGSLNHIIHKYNVKTPYNVM